MSTTQYGFQKQKWIKGALVHMMGKIIANIENNLCILGIILDLWMALTPFNEIYGFSK